ncbi:hypothetical protein CCACVL1_15254 [Corchorus capsularis]|uniref:Uncharacterized protein n=1 Tax=Corchorus capsularis TaxID=210143 RepID=A0A1R3I382_COCAP|nr:hypothetical protein CCACVL1_15254 [Corchorus capsularis]
MAGYGEEKLSTVLVTGTVVCEACHSDSQLRAWPISGSGLRAEARPSTKFNVTIRNSMEVN